MDMSQMPKEGEPNKTEITICMYADGKVAMKLDGGEEVPVESLDKALEGVRALAAHEQGEGGMPEGQEPAAEEGEDQAFASGFKGVRGGY